MPARERSLSPCSNKISSFFPDIPVGEDCFEGHSQEKLAHIVCDYIRLQDERAVAKSTSKTMPRILGIEGCWGSGKSNVDAVSIIIH